MQQSAKKNGSEIKYFDHGAWNFKLKTIEKYLRYPQNASELYLELYSLYISIKAKTKIDQMFFFQKNLTFVHFLFKIYVLRQPQPTTSILVNLNKKRRLDPRNQKTQKHMNIRHNISNPQDTQIYFQS